MPVLPSYRNQSIGLLCKSIDWFLYEENTGIKWVKKQFRDFLKTPILFRKRFLLANQKQPPRMLMSDTN